MEHREHSLHRRQVRSVPLLPVDTRATRPVNAYFHVINTGRDVADPHPNARGVKLAPKRASNSCGRCIPSLLASLAERGRLPPSIKANYLAVQGAKTTPLRAGIQRPIRRETSNMVPAVH